MGKLKLVGVVRVSGSGQAARDTPEIQREAIQKIAESYQADLVDVVEVAITVSDLTLTPQWRTRVAPRIKARDTHIAVYKTDRLARPLDWGQDLLALNALHSTGTNIYTPVGVRDLSTEEGRMITTLETLIAGGERANIIKRTQDAMKKWAANGAAVVAAHSLPCGLATTGKGKTKLWVITEDIEKVKRAFSMLLEGCTYREISTAVGYAVTPVKNWFSNDLYRGLYKSAWHPEGMDPIRIFGGPGQLEQPISDAIWSAAQLEVKKRARRYSKPKHKTEIHTLFSGRMVSAYGMAAELPNAFSNFGLDLDLRQHVVYGHLIYGRHKQTAYVCRCIHQGWAEKCGLRTWQPVERLHRGVEAHLENVTAEEWFVAELVSQITDDGEDVEAERQQLAKDIAKLDRKLAVAYDDRLEGVISLEVYRGLSERLRPQKDALTSRLHELQSKPRITEDDLREVGRSMAYRTDWPIEKKREWLDRYNVRIWLANDGVDAVNVRFPVGPDDYPVFASLGGRKWVDLVGFDLSDHWAVMEADEGLTITTRVAARLGVNKEQLRYLVRSGQVELTAKKATRYFWREEDIQKAAEILGVTYPA